MLEDLLTRAKVPSMHVPMSPEVSGVLCMQSHECAAAAELLLCLELLHMSGAPRNTYR